MTVSLPEVTVEGKACARCGGTKRYIINRACWACSQEASKKRAARRSREAAKFRGFGPKAATRQGKPCKKCGETERYVVNHACVACLKAKTKDRDSTARNRASYWNATPPKVLRRRVRAAIYSGNKRASKLGAEPVKVSIDEVFNAAMLVLRCCYCGVDLALDEIGFDHRQPLARGGTNTADNFAFCCQPCNRAKGVLTGKEYEDLLLLVGGWEDGGAALLKRLRIGFIGRMVA